MDQLDEEGRISARDAAAARVLAGGADREVHEVHDELRAFRRAATSNFNAMREDLTDIRHRVDQGFLAVRATLDAAAAGQQHISDILDVLIAREEGRGQG